MRLTIINQFYTPDIAPTAQLSASLAEHRANQGDEVTIIASRGGYVRGSRIDARSEREANPSVRRIWTPQLGKKNIITRCADYASFYLGALWKMITLPKQDVIISLTTPPYIAWTAIMHRIIHPRTRVVLWSMDCYPDAAEKLGVINKGGRASRFMRAVNRALYRRFDHIIALDHAMADLLSQYTPDVDPPETTVIPNWEDADRFSGRQPWPPAEHLQLEGRFVVLYFGNAGYGHHFETVLDAAEVLRDEPVAFLFVGGGKRWSELAGEAKQRGLENVILHGFAPRDETLGVLCTADCALITLRDESLGIMSPSKLHSSVAVGLPIAYVGPEGSNIDDAINKHGCGVSVRVGEVDGLVAFINELRTNEDACAEYQDRARTAFAESYSGQSVLPQFDALLDGLVADVRANSTLAASPEGGALR